jgi:hypothetical protein
MKNTGVHKLDLIGFDACLIGQIDVLAPFTPIDYGSGTYSEDGTYTTKKTGKSFPVSIEFEVTQDRGTLQHVWAFDKYNGPENSDSQTPECRVDYTHERVLRFRF